jgi:hypothetical protein
LKVKTAKTVTAGPVLLTSSLVQAVLLDLTAGPAKALLEPSIPTQTVLQVEAVAVAVTSEAVATAEEAVEATVEDLLVAPEMGSGRMVCTSLAHRT